MHDPWDTFADYIPRIRERQPEADYNPPAQARYAYDGGESPVAVVNPAPRQSIPPWDASIQELRISLYKHPVSPAFLRSSFNEARKAHGFIKTVAVYVMRGLGDSQSTRVLQAMGGFVKDETRSTGQGVCFVRDMRKQEPKPQPKAEPKPEPKELGWLEQELKQTVEALEARKQMGVHKSFLTTFEAQAADLQKQVDNQNIAPDTEEYAELCRQEAEVTRQLQELNTRLKDGQ